MSDKLVEDLMSACESVFGLHPVALAYLCGSSANGQNTPLSDVDVAVVTEDELTPRERLRLELGLETELGAVVEGELDVRIINQAPLLVKGSVVQTGKLLYARDDAVRVDFETTVRDLYIDFLPVARQHRNAYFTTQRNVLRERGLL